MKIQVTYYCTTGKYKPISTTVDVPNTHQFMLKKDYYIQRAKLRIMAKRYWSEKNMSNYGYTEYKTRIYKENE